MRKKGLLRVFLCLAMAVSLGVAVLCIASGICCQCLDRFLQEDDSRIMALDNQAQMQAREVMRLYLSEGMGEVQAYAERENVSYVIIKSSGRRLGGNYRTENAQQIQTQNGQTLQYDFWFSGTMREEPLRVPEAVAEYNVKIAFLSAEQVMAAKIHLEGVPEDLQRAKRELFIVAGTALALTLAVLGALMSGRRAACTQKREAYAGRFFKLPLEKLILWWVAAVPVWLWGCRQPFIWNISLDWENGLNNSLYVLGQSLWRTALCWWLLGILLLGFLLHLSVYITWRPKKNSWIVRMIKAPVKTWRQLSWFHKVLAVLLLSFALEAAGIAVARHEIMGATELGTLQGRLSGWSGWVVWVLWGVEKAVLATLALRTADSTMRLRTSGRELAAGNLGYQIPLEGMNGELLAFAQDMNAISYVVAAAVEDQMKSEHLKTELITNVSHDIKTPLTSIINYADLICRDPLDSGKTMEYAQVLYRQSTRLKKLIEDLMEVSRAATGNVEVHLERCQAGVLLSQIMGEYEQRLQEKGLDLIVKQSQESVWIMADTRLLWRILDNLMTNICKYAQSDTRVYLLLETQGEQAVLTFKNISNHPLDIDASELMERFVRGDRSRHTEGNGLGLAIARELTELQGGVMHLVTDGDLFKVILTFPMADAEAVEMPLSVNY